MLLWHKMAGVVSETGKDGT